MTRGFVLRTLHLRWGTSAPLRTRAGLRRSARGALVAGLMLWLSAACAAPPVEPVRRTAPWWNQRHARIDGQTRGKTELVFIGDSITAGWEREGRTVWQRRYAQFGAINMGIGGDETGHVLWRLAHTHLERIRPRVAVLLIGVNNAFRRDHGAQHIAAGIGQVVQQLRRRLPRTRVLLLGVFPAGARPGPLRTKIAAINRAISTLADSTWVHYLDLGQRFLQRDGSISTDVMFDYLHLTDKGYGIWAGAMEPTLRRLMSAK